jgi:hypothetical protein
MSMTDEQKAAAIACYGRELARRMDPASSTTGTAAFAATMRELRCTPEELIAAIREHRAEPETSPVLWGYRIPRI